NEIAHSERLVIRIREGDEVAFDRLFRLCYGPLVDFAHRYVPSREDAEEAITDLFMRIWETRTRWEVHGAITPYLFAAARNRALNVRAAREAHDRHYAHLQTSLEANTEAIEFDPLLAIDATELSAPVRRALQALSPRSREVFLLTQRDGLSIREAAGALGVSASTVQTQLARALNALRRTLAPPQ
ncbi:MAG: sigma-70 family RNA polymerase sigma factor, partial [Gemmatimonadota bacterium]|nr:sigma-70 family RNA polymerase sigma factor [Gemmatimonadota bacterium]